MSSRLKCSIATSCNVDFFETGSQSIEREGFQVLNVRLCDLFQDMLMAGTDTTNQEIMWMLVELMRHPHVLKKVQEELDDVVGRDRVVEEADLGQLNYLHAVIKESFRLHPVLPLMFPHLSTKPTKLQDTISPRTALRSSMCTPS